MGVDFLIVALEMNAYDRNILTRMLWDLDQSQLSINAVSQYIGKHQSHAQESVQIWEEQLSECFGERKLLFLYVLNDVIQLFRRSEVSELFISRLDSVLYAVIRDYPSLFSSVNRLIDVWKSRSVVNLESIARYHEIVQNALDDYNHNVDRRSIQPQSKQNDENHSEDGFDDFGQYDPNSVNNNPSLSNDSDIEIQHFDNPDEFNDLHDNEQNVLINEKVIRDGSRVAEAENEIDHYRHELHNYPDWVLLTDYLSRDLPELVENCEGNMNILFDAGRVSASLRTSLEKATSARKRLIDNLIEMKELKKRRVERLESLIRESEQVLDLLQSLDEGEEDTIVRVIRKPRVGMVNALSVSDEALQSISKTIKDAEEERKKQIIEEQKQQEREAEIRDSMNHSIMKTSAEDMIGKAWNAPEFFNRILYPCLLKKQALNDHYQ